jgi:drug/metabolite transporter (DMT)-like permease
VAPQSAKIVTDVFPLFLAPFLRLLAAAIVASPVLLLYRSQLRSMAGRDWLIVVGIGAIGLVAFSLFLLTGMQRVNGVAGAVVMSMSPAAMAIGADVFFGDRLGWRKILAVVLSVAGILVINVSGKSIQATGWTLVLGSVLVFGAVCSQTAYSLLAKRLTRSVHPVLIVPLAAWVAAMLFAVPGLSQSADFDFSKPSVNQWFALFWWGIGPFALGTSIWFTALHRVQASTASGFMGAMPASALILSYLWLGDKFHWIHLLGFALVFSSIGLVTWAHRIKEKQQGSGQDES